ncbi:hypothetical protein LZZ85_23750 [Terrimonas sp. NA20]|uniref:Uncharacterized protein n=1 Tax=Terrimonas ginsenosidimutans TaxID=2908004 RepID=A0ABS9KY76_9BACT|nr:hypothetical protein [Terrimonas ginsenosidimutans]MCG2617332.1 hypothetical protein [Terrimonas ginsenosidimutans]
MKSATIHELKQEMSQLKASEISALCLRLARFKKENKELLTYLLFEAHDEDGYIRSVKQEIDDQFESINVSHLYFVKKSLRKILRGITKHIRYTGSKQAEVEWLLHFCTKLKDTGIPLEKNTMINNIYHSQLKKLFAAINGLHEDLQYEFMKEAKKL